jgi:hypothetical protein
MVDCTFEREVCELFNFSAFPHMVMITRDKVYMIRSLKTVLQKEDILELLSGEDYKEKSDVLFDDTTTFLNVQTGRGGGLNSQLSVYFRGMEAQMQTFTKA